AGRKTAAADGVKTAAADGVKTAAADEEGVKTAAADEEGVKTAAADEGGVKTAAADEGGVKTAAADEEGVKTATGSDSSISHCSNSSRKCKKKMKAVTWFSGRWLHVECYMYRRLQEAVLMSGELARIDVFQSQKEAAFLASATTIEGLLSYLHETLARLEQCHAPEEELSATLGRFLQVALWGNKCDLSHSAGKVTEYSRSVCDTLQGLKHYLLVDDSLKVWDALVRCGGGGGRGGGD
ncbi:hypothetical protein Ahia01_001325400, partial [Argonauta hians]